MNIIIISCYCQTVPAIDGEKKLLEAFMCAQIYITGHFNRAAIRVTAKKKKWIP